MHVCAGAQAGQRRESEALGLELQVVVSHHVGAGLQTSSEEQPVSLTAEPPLLGPSSY